MRNLIIDFYFLPFLEALNESSIGTVSIWAESLDLARRLLSLLIASTAYLNAVSCLLSVESNNPPVAKNYSSVNIQYITSEIIHKNNIKL